MIVTLEFCWGLINVQFDIILLNRDTVHSTGLLIEEKVDSIIIGICYGPAEGRQIKKYKFDAGNISIFWV